jgi:hypothetical protein
MANSAHKRPSSASRTTGSSHPTGRAGSSSRERGARVAAEPLLEYLAPDRRLRPRRQHREQPWPTAHWRPGCAGGARLRAFAFRPLDRSLELVRR